MSRFSSHASRSRWLGLFACLCVTLAASSEAKPFRRVLVLTGGSLEFATHLGVWSGLQHAGWTPDLVISTCGSSMVSGFMQAESNAGAVREAMLSRDFFDSFRESAKVSDPSGFNALARVYLKDDLKHFPHVFGRSIMEVPLETPLPALAKGFDAQHPRVVMLASRLRHGPESQGRAWAELGPRAIQEVFLTDDDTAAEIPRDFVSPVAAWSPRISPVTEAIGGWPLWSALRASISDPYLLAPFRKDDVYYATGAVDLVPVELAMQLGDEVLITYTGAMDKANARGFENLFGFDQNARGRQSRATIGAGLRWIDLSDDTSHYKETGISPFLGNFLRIRGRMPKTYEEFREKMDRQYEYGAERAAEALGARDGGDRSHIRNPWPL